MVRLRHACAIAAAAPVVLVCCTDLSGLAGGGDSGACPSGQKLCDGGCVSIDDPAFGCGATTCDRCSVPFAATLKCEGGRCAVATCEPARADCNGLGEDGCEADLGAAATCGNCKMACGAAIPFCTPSGQCVERCPDGLTACQGACVDLARSDQNCGACGNRCASAKDAVPACEGGSCTFRCNVGFGDCDGNPANGCEPAPSYYADNDRDGHGVGPAMGQACTPPEGFAARADDCLDSNPNVHPGQTEFFATGYTTAGGATSYDYDCNGVEETPPGRNIGGKCTPSCQVGYTPGKARDLAGANEYCGSSSAVGTCSASVECSVTSAPALGCR